MTDAAVRRAATSLRRAVVREARPAGAFDARRYFRASGRLAFLNVGAARVRAIAREASRAHRGVWSAADAVAIADVLVRNRHFEVKGVGLELLAACRGRLHPADLRLCKRWLAEDCCANWATTDALSTSVVAPLLLAHPRCVAALASWTRHRNLWVRRASLVALVPLARRGLALDAAYARARALRADREDLIQKAAGWLLREAGRHDAGRLRTYLLEEGPRVPRLTLRYAIERFPPGERAALLEATRRRGDAARVRPASSVRARARAGSSNREVLR